MKIDYDKWCNQCTHYKLNLEKGVICGITNEKPNFIHECKYLKIDDNKLKWLEHNEHIRSKREQQKRESSIMGERLALFNLLKEKKLLLPFNIILLILAIYTFDNSSIESIGLVSFVFIYTIMLVFSSRYLSKSERYILVENNRVKDMIGPGLVMNLSIYKYHKIDIKSVAPDLINNKFDFKIKNRINEQIRDRLLRF